MHNFFFLKCPGSVERVRCDCGLLVPLRVPQDGWLGRGEVLPVLPARTPAPIARQFEGAVCKVKVLHLNQTFP